MADKKFDESEGVWRTIGGRRVFIRTGQSLADAMIKSGKFKNIREDYRKAKQEEEKEDKKEDKKEEVWKKQDDGSYVADKDAMKKDYEERHKKYDEKIKQLVEDRENMTNSDWEASIMAYEKQNADGTYKSFGDIYQDIEEYEKKLSGNTKNEYTKDELKEKFGTDDVDLINAGREDYRRVSLKEDSNKNIRIEDKNGELTGYTDGERIEYSHSGSTGLMANVYSTDDGKLSGQYFEIPKEYQGDKLKDYSLKEIERLKSDKEAYETRQKEGMDKFISKSTSPFYPDTEYSKEDLKRMEENGIKPMDNTYSGNGWEGINSDKNLSTKEQAKAVTDEMKKQFPDVKISRKSDVYSMGSSIDFNIMSSDKDLFVSDSDIDKMGYEDLRDVHGSNGYEWWAKENVKNYNTDHYSSIEDIRRYAKESLAQRKQSDIQGVRGNEWYLNDYGKKVVSELNKQANSYTYDDSDAMTDYFNHGTYMHISIGKWNKPYQVNEKKTSGNQITNSLQRKAYEKYLKEHPASKMSFEDFKKEK